MIDRHMLHAGLWVLASALIHGCSAGDDAMRGDPAGPVRPSTQHGSGGASGATPLGVGNAPMMEMEAAAGAPAEVQVGGAKPGTFMPSAMLDPNAEFDWPEALEGSKCESGTYTGTFECTFMVDPVQAAMFPFGAPAPGDIPPVNGPITLTFEKSADGEFLELTDALLNGVAMDFIGFDATLAGRLDCATMQLTAQITTGQFGFGSPVLFQFGEIAGDVNGALDGQTGTLNGRWNIGVGPADMAFGACEGPWTANFTP